MNSPTVVMRQPQHRRIGDPGGVNPDGVEMMTGEDPDGIRAFNGASPLIMAAPPTPSKNHTTEKVAFSLLVGKPPPPPATPPPRKKRSNSAMRPSQASAIKDIKPNKSVDDSYIEDWKKSSLSKQNIVEEKLRAARAIYEAHDMVLLDPPTDGLGGRQSTAGTPKAANAENERPKSPKILPSSITTSSIGSDDKKVTPLSQRVVSNTDLKKPTSDSVTKAHSKANTLDPKARRIQTPDRRRSKTPDGRRVAVKADHVEDVNSLSTNKSKKSAETPKFDNKDIKKKRGFFGKIFGKKKNKSSESIDARTTTSDVGATVNSQDGTIVRQKSGMSPPTTLKAVASSNGHNDFDEVNNDRAEVFFPSDDVSTLTAPTVESKRKRQDPSQEIPSDQSSDPMGQYWDIAHLKTEFDGQADFEIVANKNIRPNAFPTHDPLGNSPINSVKTEQVKNMSNHQVRDPSPRGRQTPTFNDHLEHDPIGASPLHKYERGPTAFRDGSPYAPDPPLYLGDEGLVSEGSSTDEEKKDGDDRKQFSDTGSIPPPPPPVVSPRAYSRDRLRIPISPRPANIRPGQSTQETIDYATRQLSTSNADFFSAKHSVESLLHDSDTGEAFIPSPEVNDDERNNMNTEVISSLQTNQKTQQVPQNALSIRAMARMNAKAVHYIHTINGEPSPRHTWRQDHAPAELANAVKPISSNGQSQNAFFAKEIGRDASDDSDAVMKLFSAYSGKFKGRNPAKGQRQKSPRTLDTTPRVFPPSPPPPPPPRRNLRSTGKSNSAPGKRLGRDTSIRGYAVKKGFAMMKESRERDIASGRSKRVVLYKNHVPPKVKSYFTSSEEPEPRDPIQRAGRRLLSKAAVPIQSAARRYLAQCEAVDRMWGLIEIQCYLRRWRAEAAFLAHRQAATKIQSFFRRRRESRAAIQIQKIVRGYLSAAKTYDTVFMIILLQARARGNFARKRFQIELGARREAAALHLQTVWRAYAARSQYQFDIVDIIIVQSVARKWLAQRSVAVVRNSAAIKIQATWRGFQAYTDYIFALVDVLVVQRVARRWLANKRVTRIRQNVAATMIQAYWRRHECQTVAILQLGNIILVQSVVRKHFANKILAQKRLEAEELSAAAVKVQSAWRGFWSYSHYIILQYEAARLQAIVRGNLVRRDFNLRLGCIIMIQAAARRYLAKMYVEEHKEAMLIEASEMRALRERFACKRIQFWWRVVLDCRKEKEAALKIERFFIMVKNEVEREIRRVESKKRDRRRRRTKKETEDNLLERVWLNTVDEDKVDVFAIASPRSSKSMDSRSLASTRMSLYAYEDKGVKHRASSPTMKMVMRHDREDDSTEMSVLTNNSTYTRYTEMKKARESRKEISQDRSLEEAFRDSKVTQGKERNKAATEKYLKMYGIKTAPHGSERIKHFFADDLESPSSSFSESVKKGRQSLPSSQTRRRRDAPGYASSPSRGKILMMNPYPEFSTMRKSPRARDNVEYVGDEFSEI